MPLSFTISSMRIFVDLHIMLKSHFTRFDLYREQWAMKVTVMMELIFYHCSRVERSEVCLYPSNVCHSPSVSCNNHRFAIQLRPNSHADFHETQKEGTYLQHICHISLCTFQKHAILTHVEVPLRKRFIKT